MPDSRLRILHVDDQHLWRSTVSDYLPLFGDYQITSAESGEQALSLLKQTAFDVVVCDYKMPEMNGIQLLISIRSQGDTIPFILFTGLMQDSLATQAKESGADFYCEKTGDPDRIFTDLNHKILQAVERHETVDALVSYTLGKDSYHFS